MASGHRLLLSLLIIAYLSISSTADPAAKANANPLVNVLENAGMNVVKKQFDPKDLNALVNDMNGPHSNQQMASPDWNDLSFQGFWSSLAMIIVSEIGDKTFFIAAILAMKHSRFIIWLGGAGALFVMTVMAVVFGSILLSIVPPEVTHYGAGLLFLVFAVKLLYEGHQMKGGEASEELREVEEELRDKEKREMAERRKRERKQERERERDIELGALCDDDNAKRGKRDSHWTLSVLLNAFAMTFVSEIGDRSQITTIVLAAHKSPYGVMAGATLGHAICTGIAVLGGKFLASRISEKNVTLIGGFLFLVFAVETFIVGPEL